MKRTTPEEITQLTANEIFVFGSNTRGIHGRGAALQAMKCFGARPGVGEGLTGDCYAFPTLNADYVLRILQLNKRTHGELWKSAEKFIQFATAHPDLTLLLTKVGCGLAGFSEEYMKSFFVDTPSNVVKPEGW